MSKKKLTFRQRLRADASDYLDTLINTVHNSAAAVASETGATSKDLLRLACGGHVKSLREAVITKLANAREAELEAIYNQQQDLLGEDE